MILDEHVATYMLYRILSLLSQTSMSASTHFNQKQFLNDKFIASFVCLLIEGTCKKTKHKSLSFGYEDNCYTLHFEPVSWARAFLNCQKKGSYLAQMKTKKAINDISLKIKYLHRESVYYWIGLKRSRWHTLDKPGIVKSLISLDIYF